MDAYIAGKLHRLSPAKSIGKGGEADVYDLGNGQVAKLYKQPDHPDYDGMPAEQQAARLRIATHQTKLPAYPKGLPSRVVAPVDLVTDKGGRAILGFTMPFLKNTKVLLHYQERAFRSAGVDGNMVTRIFRDMHSTVRGIHKAGVVIGDFNDLNVLVAGEEAHFIDADSFQFGRFPCGVFTARFVDPTLCSPTGASLELARPHTAMSDWYAFNVMLFQCLLYVGPYGGVYKPKDQANRLPHDARPLRRITVFDQEVKYPKPAVHYSVLSDEMLHHFHRVFQKDERREFPDTLLEMQWTVCSKCGLEFARPACPTCATPAPGMVKETITVRGTVTCITTFKTRGRILFAALQGGKLLHLWHEVGKFRREGDRVVLAGDVDSRMRFRIRGDDTLIARDHALVTLRKDEYDQEERTVDTYQQIPVFDANANGRFWLSGGRLFTDSKVKLGAFDLGELVGTVLQDQTMFWVGEHLGFGFYRADKLSVAFLFRPGNPGINDRVKIPQITGQLLDSTCWFSKDRFWFATAFQEAGVIRHRIVALKGDGTVEAVAEATAGDGTWLGTLRGKAAAGQWLFASTDDGIVRLEVQGGKVVIAKEYPDTEPFVDAGCHLFPAPQGLYVVTPNEIRLLEIR